MLGSGVIMAPADANTTTVNTRNSFQARRDATRVLQEVMSLGDDD